MCPLFCDSGCVGWQSLVGVFLPEKRHGNDHCLPGNVILMRLGQTNKHRVHSVVLIPSIPRPLLLHYHFLTTIFSSSTISIYLHLCFLSICFLIFSTTISSRIKMNTQHNMDALYNANNQHNIPSDLLWPGAKTALAVFTFTLEGISVSARSFLDHVVAHPWLYGIAAGLIVGGILFLTIPIIIGFGRMGPIKGELPLPLTQQSSMAKAFHANR